MKLDSRSKSSKEQRPGAAAPAAPAAPSRTLSAGLVAMAPLLAALEWVFLSSPDAPRNAGVALVDVITRPAGARLDQVRWVALALALGAALIVLRLRRVELFKTLARIVLEGLAFALVLGPALVALARVAEQWIGPVDVSWDPTHAPPTLHEVGLAVGAGAWEELLFRVGVYSLCFLLALRVATALGAGARASRWLAELGGLTVSSLAFAAAHFAPFATWLELPVREFRPEAFGWLCLGGAALGLIFRWRGPGVAAWAHALFNVALWIGIDPDVIW